MCSLHQGWRHRDGLRRHASRGHLEVHPYDIFRREITIKGSFAEIASFPAAITALGSGRVRSDGLITHRYGLDESGRALDDFTNDKSLHKAVVSPLA